MMKFVFLDVHLTLRNTKVKSQSVSTILSRVVASSKIKFGSKD